MSARALTYTILGEFVLPGPGTVWTSTMVTACQALDVGEKNARQALARVGDQGILAGEKFGRSVQWSLTDQGRSLLTAGEKRIYSFGAATQAWDGRWLLAHCPVPEQQRKIRDRLRSQLAFLGFGEVSASLLVSPHVDREAELHQVLESLGLIADSIVWRARAADVGSGLADERIASRAWDLDVLAEQYRRFIADHGAAAPGDDREVFAALVRLVDDWRQFPFVDPELPADLLPATWAGAEAHALFDDRHRAWAPAARRWFTAIEQSNATERT